MRIAAVGAGDVPALDAFRVLLREYEESLPPDLRIPDLETELRLLTERYPAPQDALCAAVRGLSIDFASPIEPLRNLPQDLEQLFAAMGELHAALGKRLA